MPCREALIKHNLSHNNKSNLFMRQNWRHFEFRLSDRTNVCCVKEGCSSLKPAACSSLLLEVVASVDFEAATLNLHLNKGHDRHEKVSLQPLNNALVSCNPPCLSIRKPWEYCYMSTHNFSKRRHIRTDHWCRGLLFELWSFFLQTRGVVVCDQLLRSSTVLRRHFRHLLSLIVSPHSVMQKMWP